MRNALSSTIALFVVGVAVLMAGILMLLASIRARLAYRHARRTRQRIAGKVVGNKPFDEEFTPVVEYTDPRTRRRVTFSPPMGVSWKLEEGREVPVLWDERGREPILDLRTFRAGFAGHALFLLIALVCAGCGVLAIYAVLRQMS